MLSRYPEDEPESLEVKDYIQGFFGILKDFAALVGELPDLKYGIFLLVHEFHEALDEGSQLLPGRNDVPLVHDGGQINYIIIL
jgi:hypothetical protein